MPPKKKKAPPSKSAAVEPSASQRKSTTGDVLKQQQLQRKQRNTTTTAATDRDNNDVNGATTNTSVALTHRVEELMGIVRPQKGGETEEERKAVPNNKKKDTQSIRAGVSGSGTATTATTTPPHVLLSHVPLTQQLMNDDARLRSHLALAARAVYFVAYTQLAQVFRTATFAPMTEVTANPRFLAAVEDSLRVSFTQEHLTHVVDAFPTFLSIVTRQQQQRDPRLVSSSSASPTPMGSPMRKQHRVEEDVNHLNQHHQHSYQQQQQQHLLFSTSNNTTNSYLLASPPHGHTSSTSSILCLHLAAIPSVEECQAALKARFPTASELRSVIAPPTNQGTSRSATPVAPGRVGTKRPRDTSAVVSPTDSREGASVKTGFKTPPPPGAAASSCGAENGAPSSSSFAASSSLIPADLIDFLDADKRRAVEAAAAAKTMVSAEAIAEARRRERLAKAERTIEAFDCIRRLFGANRKDVGLLQVFEALDKEDHQQLSSNAAAGSDSVSMIGGTSISLTTVSGSSMSLSHIQQQNKVPGDTVEQQQGSNQEEEESERCTEMKIHLHTIADLVQPGSASGMRLVERSSCEGTSEEISASDVESRYLTVRSTEKEEEKEADLLEYCLALTLDRRVCSRAKLMDELLVEC